MCPVNPFLKVKRFLQITELFALTYRNHPILCELDDHLFEVVSLFLCK
uniref:Uncharacterized protein n=1 Tax=Anguilla anguilla TaxID=7936 RepID=A0A0E9PQ04_ANGAN